MSDAILDLSKPSGIKRGMTLRVASKHAAEFLAPRQGLPRQKEFVKELDFMAKVLGARKPIEEVTRQDIVTMMSAYKRRGIEVYDHYLLTLSCFFNVCRQDGAIDVNPVQWSRLPLPPRRKPRRSAFTYEQFQSVLEIACDTQRFFPYWGLAITIAYYTGLRCGDVACLRWSDNGEHAQSYVDMAGDMIVARPHKRQTIRQRLEIPLEHDLAERLVIAWNDREDPEDPWVLTLMRMHYKWTSRANITGQFRIICDRAGLPEHSFHSFRHGFVSRLVNNGVTPIIVAEMTGQTLNVIQEYCHVDLATKADALRTGHRAVHAAKMKQLGIVPERAAPPVLKL